MNVLEEIGYRCCYVRFSSNKVSDGENNLPVSWWCAVLKIQIPIFGRPSAVLAVYRSFSIFIRFISDIFLSSFGHRLEVGYSIYGPSFSKTLTYPSTFIPCIQVRFARCGTLTPAKYENIPDIINSLNTGGPLANETRKRLFAFHNWWAHTRRSSGLMAASAPCSPLHWECGTS